ncbi:exopolysaccharide biosynthesis polyprenyl glycosylphosphotransferase [Actinoplanes sp. NPDC051343]|uniref:exopolysaccharide biosynthesis polyprenyl glycosylphosphotransferase n=1 Tax=Actinoplanes sp. NPDC051343 TaxID=3363906 RepID=UPI00379EBAA1
MFQFASLTREGSSSAVALRTDRPRPTASAAPAPALRRPMRGAIGEAVLLLTLDTTALLGGTYAVGCPLPAVAVRALATLLIFGLAGLYRARLQFSVLDDLPRLILGVAAVVAGGAWLAARAGGGLVGRSLTPVTPLGAAALLTALVLARTAGYRLLRRHRRRSPGRVTLLFGCDGVAQMLAEALRADRAYGLVPVGFVGTRPLTPPRLPVLASADGLEKAIKKYKPVHLIVTFPPGSDTDLVARLRQCRRGGLSVHIVPRLHEIGGLTGAEHVHGIPLVRLRPEPAQTRRWAVKRMIDVAGAALGLLLLSPILLICMLLVRLESRRHGVLFRQERISRDGRPFTILKFRSLTPATALESQVKWNINEDVRLGRIGKLLRFSSLDELPQLFNVLRGDMSLVGPRPERPYFVQQFQRTYSGYADRHRVPAGITGWAQIHGLRGDTSIEDRVRYDNHYIEHWSLGLDLKIILRTVGSMLSIHRV